MLVSVSGIHLPSLGIERRAWTAFHPKLWVMIATARGGSIDDRLMPKLPQAPPSAGRRRLAGFVLDGESIVTTHAGSSIVRGAGISCDGRTTYQTGVRALEEASLSIAVEWDADFFGSASVGGLETFPLSSKSNLRAEVGESCRAIETAWRRPQASGWVCARLVRLFSAMRAEGLDLPHLVPEDLATTWPSHVVRLSRAFDEAISMTEERPTIVDLEQHTGASERSVSRHIRHVLAARPMSPATFAQARRRARLSNACFLTSNPRVTTSLATRIMGFASPNSFCAAFLKAGLPAPGMMSQMLRALG